jgi:hypothetical protein
LTFAGRALANKKVQAGTVTLDPSTKSTQPTFTIWSGASEIYQTVHFTVPAHASNLQFTTAYAYTKQNSLLHVALFDPSGTYMGYSDTQGLTNFTSNEVVNPVAGTWSAFLFTVSNNNSATAKGTSGPVSWEAYTYSASTVSVGVEQALASAKKSGSAKFVVTLPSNPGDNAFSIVVASGTNRFVIPVTEQVSIPVVNSVGTFTGVLTGGNGRAGAAAQSKHLQLHCPAWREESAGRPGNCATTTPSAS